MEKPEESLLRLIFVSYSSRDEEIVSPLARLVVATGVEVFFARATIPDGALWRRETYEKLRGAFRALIFWSINAAASQWVRREYRYAMRHRVPLVPVLLDATELPPELARYQALDALLPTMRKALAVESRIRARPPRKDLLSHEGSADKLLWDYAALRVEVTKMILSSAYKEPGT